jgi:hypothetical protein
MVEPLADQMVDLSRKDIFILQPHPPEKTGGLARHFPPRKLRRASPNDAPSGATAQSETKSAVRIFREKSSNFNQKAALDTTCKVLHNK